MILLVWIGSVVVWRCMVEVSINLCKYNVCEYGDCVHDCTCSCSGCRVNFLQLYQVLITGE